MLVAKYKTGTYVSWKSMMERCYRPKHVRYGNYGGRGITVCHRWLTFENFLADMGERPAGTSIDRIDVSQGYEPDNCRWSSRLEQARNTTQTKLTLEKANDIRRRVANGEFRTGLAAEYGVARSIISDIIKGNLWTDRGKRPRGEMKDATRKVEHPDPTLPIPGRGRG